MGKFRYYIDVDKAREKSAEKGIDIEPIPPVIKSSAGSLFGDAGIDLFSPINVTIPPLGFQIVDSFVGFAFEPGVGGLLFPRSSDWFLLGAGVIDTGYTGTIKAKIFNPMPEELVIKVGDSIGQLVLFVKAHVETPELVQITKVELGIMSERGEDGGIVRQFGLQ